MSSQLRFAACSLVFAALLSSRLNAQHLERLPSIIPEPAEAVQDRSSLTPAEEVATTELPIMTDTPSWLSPSTWFNSPLWEYGIELGINGSEGNAQSLSILAAGRFKRETERNKLKMEVVYGKSEANSVLTQHYGFFESRWDWNLSDSRWFLFNLTRLEFDEFKAFDSRVSMSGGLGYHLIKTEEAKLTGRFGAGTSREFGGPNDKWVPEAILGMDYEHKLTQRQKLNGTFDYFPDWGDFMDYRLVSQASWELLLDEETNLSLKVGLIDRYDSTPEGRKPNDLDYFLTLLWKW